MLYILGTTFGAPVVLWADRTALASIILATLCPSATWREIVTVLCGTPDIHAVSAANETQLTPMTRLAFIVVGGWFGAFILPMDWQMDYQVMHFLFAELSLFIDFYVIIKPERTIQSQFYTVHCSETLLHSLGLRLDSTCRYNLVLCRSIIGLALLFQFFLAFAVTAYLFDLYAEVSRCRPLYKSYIGLN